MSIQRAAGDLSWLCSCPHQAPGALEQCCRQKQQPESRQKPAWLIRWVDTWRGWEARQSEPRHGGSTSASLSHVWLIVVWLTTCFTSTLQLKTSLLVFVPQFYRIYYTTTVEASTNPSESCSKLTIVFPSWELFFITSIFFRFLVWYP